MGRHDRPVASNVAAGRRVGRLVDSRSRALWGPAVDFRILGPLEVARDGGSVVLGAVQQRALLAVLVLHRGEVVSTDRLVDELWGERIPAAATKTVQVYVSHLRKALGAGVIVTQGRGYRLAVAPEQVDAIRFEALGAEGRRALSDGDAARAKERLCSALGLWRGEPLAEFTYEPFAQAAIARLQDARLAAQEDRIEAELALGADGELIGEIELLIAANPLQERLRGQLMLALYRAGRQADALAVYRQTSELLREELGLEPSRLLQELERAILGHDASLDGSRHAGVARGLPVEVCPFKGLAVFDRDDAEYFCGREGLVADLLARLVESPLVGILGSSGVGKSSLLRAGVLPALGAGSLPGSERWRQVLLRPGAHPDAELSRALAGEAPGRALGRLAPGERLVIAVDQLEEMFTLCEQEGERAAFAGRLAGAAGDAERRALVVVSLRADFYGRLASYPRLAALVSANHVLVGPMDRQDLARAIENPSARAGLEVERPLVEALVSDVAGEPGGLPLLSTTLLQLWRARDGRALRYSSYRAIGGVRGAVARLAEDAYNQLGDGEQRIARGLMLRLASGEDGTLARRRVPLGELERIPGARPVLAELTDARLLTVSDGEVELSHEALLREWPRYRTWLEEDRIGRRLHAHLTAAARDWDEQGRDAADVYRGARLAAALEWRAGHEPELNQAERAFLDASRAAAGRVQHRLQMVLAAVAALLLVAVATGVVALISQQRASNQARVALARQLGAQAVNEPRLDRAMLLAREAVNLDRSPQTEGTLLATLQRNPAVIGTFALPVDLASQLAVSPDGRTLAVSHFRISKYGFTDDPRVSLGDIRFYDPRTRAQQRAPVPHFGGVAAPVYSRDGSLLAYPTDNPDLQSIAVRDAHTLRRLATLTFDPIQAARLTPDVAHAGIMIAPDGRTIYCAYRVYDLTRSFAKAPGATYLARWSLPSGRLLSTTRIDPGAVLAVRLIDEGARLLVVDAHSVSTFDASPVRRVSSVAITPTSAPLSAAAISPDGATVAVGSPTGQVSFVDSSTGQGRPGTGAHGSAVTSLTYSPDGRSVVSTGNDNKVIVWDPQTAQSAEVLAAPAEQVQYVAFSPDGTTLYTSSLGGVLLEWDLTGDRSFGRHFAVGPGSPCCRTVLPPAPPLALSPNGSTFAVRLGTSTVGLFSAHTLHELASFTIGPKGTMITALAWSPTRPVLAVAGYSGLVQLWRVDGTPRLARSLTGLYAVPGAPEAVQALAFSPDGRFLAASDSSRTDTRGIAGIGLLTQYGTKFAVLAIWRASNGTLVVPQIDLGAGQGPADALAFSRHGGLLAASRPDSSVLILDPATGQVRHWVHPLGADETVSLAFAPNGTLATGTGGGIVQLWNPASGDQIAGPVAVAAGPVTSIAFDPTGQRFATTGGQDGTVKLWSSSTLEQEGTALNTEQGAATTAAFEPGGKNLLVVDDHGNGFTWPTSLAAWERRACTVAGRNLTPAEWARYIPGHPYTRICP
jgi:DNA-binding SARP family transcriptional activator/WD40 repeat protein